MSFLNRFRRTRLPEGWRPLVERYVALWHTLDDGERDVLVTAMDHLLTTKRWEAAQGFELDDRKRVVIAAQAALLILGLDVDWYRDVDTIIVHPTTMRFRCTGPGPVAGTEVDGDVDLLGEANYRGPVVIAWDTASADARHPARGHAVVLHEFAHKLDMLDQVVDGTPPLPDRAARERWIEVCTREFDLLDRADGSDPVLDDYGATDPGEFFAVATEAFFTVPAALASHKPDLYGVLRDFYRQDPVRRAPRR